MGCEHRGKNHDNPSEGEQMGAFSSRSSLLGSESGIHVSRGLVLDGVMGVSLSEGGLAKRPGPRGGGGSGTTEDRLSHCPPALSTGLLGCLP